ncbi:MAG TPA: histidine phosphotransferase family protein [Stellaceae bacterium]|nr:histidine phosphotransferase family protein [Stellaceae bacterium]
MSLSVDLRIVELMAARLCHDLIGPVAAIGNGVELMAEEAPDFVGEAIALVGDSARKANKRLQFYRFAYGFSGGGLTGPPPHVLAVDFFAESAIVCDYGAAARILPLDQQKLACAMLAVAGEALPRGGRLALEVEAAGQAIGLAVEAVGEGRGPSPEIRAALQLGVPVGELNSRAVGGYFAGLLGEALGWRLDVADRPGGFRLAAAAR